MEIQKNQTCSRSHNPGLHCGSASRLIWLQSLLSFQCAHTHMHTLLPRRFLQIQRDFEACLSPSELLPLCLIRSVSVFLAEASTMLPTSLYPTNCCQLRLPHSQRGLWETTSPPFPARAFEVSLSSDCYLQIPDPFPTWSPGNLLFSADTRCICLIFHSA